MEVTQAAAQPAWWSQSFPSGERDVKEDVRSDYVETAAGASGDDGWGSDGFGFDDFLDIVNPLQHLPFISTLYREITGDTIEPAARMAGGTLYGGPAGLIASAANLFVEAEAGADIGSTMVAQLTGDDAAPSTIETPQTETLLAEAPAEIAPQPQTVPQPKADLGNLPSPQALAAYAQASALGTPGRAGGAVDWTSGVITQKQESGPSLQSVSGSGLDALIRESQAKAATRKRGPSLPSLTQPGLKNRGAGQTETASVAPAPPANRAGLADWMMKALDKYETMKVPGQQTG
ncbi:hypothetical protein NUH88_11045 [Nisaea acidiphila]|uniref:Uncharacterized protein n=1 Tax=Nisaea acidiphila TaxID=1862145 RepID=A0A9J7ANQ0_9PROT|nr:hypothetical protein [Nisaea acidiphila]UUX47956.1 hypothetical protein NUH88_11045 [Nisaea acidiphila]